MERSPSSGIGPDGKIAKFFVRQEYPLHAAAKRGDDSEVERLLAFGRSDVNETDRHGQTYVSAFILALVPQVSLDSSY